MLSNERPSARARVPHDEGFEWFEGAGESGKEGADAHAHESDAGRSQPSHEVNGVAHVIEQPDRGVLLIGPVERVTRRAVVEAESEQAGVCETPGQASECGVCARVLPAKRRAENDGAANLGAVGIDEPEQR